MTRTKKPATVAVFPALMTLGKLQRGAAPEKVLKAFDALENKRGKKAVFNAFKVLAEVSGWEKAETTEEKIRQASQFNQVFKRLETLGLVEGPPENKYLNHAERQYRLTPVSRTALKYI